MLDILERFEIWSEKLAGYVSSKESKQPFKIDKSKLLKGLPESEQFSNAIYRSYISNGVSIGYTLYPAIAEAKERPFSSFIYKTFLLNEYKYQPMPISNKDPFVDLCESNNVTIMLFEQLNRTLPRFLPKQFQLPDDTIAFIETGATMFNYVDTNEFYDQVIKIFFRIGENNYYSFDIGLNYKDRPLPFYSEPVTKAGDHTFKIKEQIEHDNPKRLNPSKIKRTSFEYATRFENLRIQEHKRYYEKQLKKLPEDQQRKSEDYNKNHPRLYEYMFLASKSKDDNLLNFIIRGIQTNLLTFKDNDVYKKFMKLCGIGTLVKYYDKFDSGKSVFEIIKSAIGNCKLPIDPEGFKKLITKSIQDQYKTIKNNLITNNYKNKEEDLDKVNLDTHTSGHKTTDLKSKRFHSDNISYVTAKVEYGIPKSTYYRHKNKLNKKLTSEYLKELQERHEEREKHKGIIRDLAEYYNLPETTIQKHLTYYITRFRKKNRYPQRNSTKGF